MSERRIRAIMDREQLGRICSSGCLTCRVKAQELAHLTGFRADLRRLLAAAREHITWR